VVRQTVSKWEQNRSVPDADLLVRLGEILEVPVSVLLGAEPTPGENTDAVAEQLARINEQLAVKNRRARRIWVTLAVLLGLWCLLTLANVVLYSYQTDTESTVIVEVEEEVIDE
jgi:putative transcriptional regulator